MSLASFPRLEPTIPKDCHRTSGLACCGEQLRELDGEIVAPGDHVRLRLKACKAYSRVFAGSLRQLVQLVQQPGVMR